MPASSGAVSVVVTLPLASVVPLLAASAPWLVSNVTVWPVIGALSWSRTVATTVAVAVPLANSVLGVADRVSVVGTGTYTFTLAEAKL
jgi:hypothetical protein